jgi:hypothetical protein
MEEIQLSWTGLFRLLEGIEIGLYNQAFNPIASLLAFLSDFFFFQIKFF